MKEEIRAIWNCVLKYKNLYHSDHQVFDKAWDNDASFLHVLIYSLNPSMSTSKKGTTNLAFNFPKHYG